MTVAEALAGGSDVIKSLHTELLLQAQRSVRTTADDAAGRHVVIMGDKQIPYRLLKKIMVTCTEANYNHFALAVLHKSGGSS